jgi:hypothetical protein
MRKTAAQAAALTTTQERNVIAKRQFSCAAIQSIATLACVPDSNPLVAAWPPAK